MKPLDSKPALILEAAGALLLKHGLRGTSMEAIAREAGIAKPTLYAYFPDKQAVFMAVAEHVIASWRRDFLAALMGEGDVVDRIGSALVVRHKSAMRLMNSSPHAAELFGEHHQLAGARIREFELELQRALESELRRAGIERAKLLAQVLLAASAGVGRKASSPAELGPALRLLCERLIRPELPGP